MSTKDTGLKEKIEDDKDKKPKKLNFIPWAGESPEVNNYFNQFGTVKFARTEPQEWRLNSLWAEDRPSRRALFQTLKWVAIWIIIFSVSLYSISQESSYVDLQKQRAMINR
jgi:hypothetical protein